MHRSITLPYSRHNSVILQSFKARDEIVTVDDSDPSVQYSNDWVTSGVQEEYDGTVHGTLENGATATFTFNGTSVAVYGTIEPSSTEIVSTYSIDNEDPFVVDMSSSGDLTIHQKLFYQSPPLSGDQHTLVITCRSTESVFWLDYFKIMPPSSKIILPSSQNIFTASPSMTTSADNKIQTSISSQTIPSALVSANSPTSVQSQSATIIPMSTVTPPFLTIANISSSTSTGTSISTSTSTSPASSVLPPSQPPSASSRSKASIGAIVGGVLGAIILLLIPLCLLLWRRHQRRMIIQGSFTSSVTSVAPIDRRFALSGYVTRGGTTADKLRSEDQGSITIPFPTYLQPLPYNVPISSHRGETSTETPPSYE